MRTNGARPAGVPSAGKSRKVAAPSRSSGGAGASGKGQESGMTGLLRARGGPMGAAVEVFAGK